MKTVIELPQGRIEIVGTASLASDIRNALSLRNQTAKIVAALNETQHILPTPGATDIAKTIGMLTTEIAKLRQQLIVENNAKSPAFVHGDYRT